MAKKINLKKRLKKAETGIKTPFTTDAPQNNQYQFDVTTRPQEESITIPGLEPTLLPERMDKLQFNPNPQQDKTNINFKKPHLNLLPTMGNKYLNRGVQYANNALNHAFAINTNPNSWEQPLDYYNGISNQPLTADVKNNTMADGGLQQNGYNFLQGAGAITNGIQSGINFGKGTLDIIGSQLQNNQVQNMENQLYTQSVFSGGIDSRPSEIYGYSNLGRNALAENGLQIKEIGGQGQANTEVEGMEHIKLPNGFSQEIQGKKHSEGGIPLNLPIDSKVFSEKLKIETDKGKKSYADMAKPFETKKHFDMLKTKSADSIQKSTAEMMIKFKNSKLEQLFNKQEEDKIAGLHGSKIQNETLGEYGFGGSIFIENIKGLKNNIQEFQKGGKKLYEDIYNNSIESPSYTPEQLINIQPNLETIIDDRINRPLINIPLQNKFYSPGEASELIKNFKESPTYKYINDAPNLNAGKKRLKEQLQLNKSLTPELERQIDSAKSFQEMNPIGGILQLSTIQQHPEAAEHYGFNIPSTREGLNALVELGQLNPNNYPGVFDKNGKALIGVKSKDFNTKYKEDIAKKVQNLPENLKSIYAKRNYNENEWFFRNPEFKSFKFNNKEDYDRYVNDNQQNKYGDYFYSGTEGLYLKPEYPGSTSQTPLKTPDVKNQDPTIIEKIKYKQPNYNIDPTLNVEFPLPNVYSRTPLNYYQVDPNYIDPRYLDIQPQLNEIQRGQRAFQNNLGDRGTASLSNLLQSQVNAYNQQQQAYGNKYNYDRGQDAQAQQFNAQMKTNVDQYNQQSWFNQLENPIRMRESNIGDQELTDMYRGQERADQRLAFNNTKNYIDKSVPYYNNMSQADRLAMMEILSKYSGKDKKVKDDKVKDNKYGGKIKLKLKKKS